MVTDVSGGPTLSWWRIEIISFFQTLSNHYLRYVTLRRLTLWSKVFEKFKVPRLLKKFQVFCGYAIFIAVFTTASHLSLSWPWPIRSTPQSCFVNNHFNIILPFTPWSSKYSISLRHPHKALHAPVLLAVYTTCLPHNILPSHKYRQFRLATRFVSFKRYIFRSKMVVVGRSFTLIFKILWLIYTPGRIP